MFEVKINNIEANADLEKYPYIVARLSNGEFWYWGCYATYLDAEKVRVRLSFDTENAAVFKYVK